MIAASAKPTAVWADDPIWSTTSSPSPAPENRGSALDVRHTNHALTVEPPGCRDLPAKSQALDVLGALATALHLAQDAGDLAAEFEIDGALRVLEDELAT